MVSRRFNPPPPLSFTPIIIPYINGIIDNENQGNDWGCLGKEFWGKKLQGEKAYGSRYGIKRWEVKQVNQFRVKRRRQITVVDKLRFNKTKLASEW